MGLIRTQKDGKAVRNAYVLEMLEVETGQNTARQRAREGRSLAGEVRHKGWSGHTTKVSQKEALTSWKGHRPRLIST